jgi:hypothetical protein
MGEKRILVGTPTVKDHSKHTDEKIMLGWEAVD